jgi:putative acetyltransferase
MLPRLLSKGRALLPGARARRPAIRPCTEADHAAVTAVWLAANRVAHPFLDEDFLREEQRNLRNVYLPGAETWVAEAHGRVVGFISLMGHQVGGLFLSPAWQGRGLGRALMDKAVAERGALELDVFQANVVARRFYHRYGFLDAGDYVHAPTGQRVLRLSRPAP